MKQSSKHLRLGLLGDWTDPVAQLLEDLPSEQDTEFVPLVDPAAAAADLDAILALSQADALAHLPALIASGKPCRIVLRRRGPATAQLEWHAGLRWLMQCLTRTEWTSWELLALTAEAAEELTGEFGLPVTSLAPLRQIQTERPRVAISRDTDVITFAFDTKNGRRETRRAQLSVYNWARLRRLAQLFVADRDDPELADVINFANGTPNANLPAGTQTKRAPVILAVVPNGVGLGHITRMMGIARALNQSQNARVVFWSFSRAAEILQAAGFEVVLRQNAVHLRTHPPSWRQWETLEFARMIAHLKADVVSYDGGTFDNFIIDALRMPGCGRCGVLWVRRGMLRPEADAAMLEAEQYCDLVLEPGDLAVEMDKGPTRTKQANYKGFTQYVNSPPITLMPFLPPYSRRKAKKLLQLGWRRHCLISLGGAFGDWDQLRDLISHYAAKHGIGLIWAQSPLAPPPDNPDDATNIRQFYPVNRYLNAFDGVISATGYNSYHELMLGYDGPVLLAPTNNVRLDDQVARASYADAQRWAHVVYSDRLHEQAQIIEKFMQQVKSDTIFQNRPRIPWNTDALSKGIFDVCARYRK